MVRVTLLPIGLRTRVVGAVRLNNIVLGLRQVDPAVDGEVRARAGGRVGCGVSYVAEVVSMGRARV